VAREDVAPLPRRPRE